MRVFLCETCGGPLDAPWDQLVIVCSYCGTQNLDGRPGGPVPARVPADERVRLNLGGRTYVLEGPLGRGDSSDVYRARWVVRLGELVFVKVEAAAADPDLLRGEWECLIDLQGSTADGADHFVSRLPAPVAHGLIDSDRPRVASVFGWMPGFSHSLSEACDEHPDGVPGEVLVWLLKRLLEELGFVHRSGWVHGAVTPDHVLVHPRDHGAQLIGWTVAQRWSAGKTRALEAIPERWAELYDGGREATPRLDIAMACRTVQAAAGRGGVSRGPVRRVFEKGIAGADDAWELADELSAASLEEHGEPAYNPLALRGWS